MRRIEKIFIEISILFLLTLVITYSWRFIYYYRLEHAAKRINKPLITVLTDPSKLVTSGSGLYKTNDKYIYKGQVDNNYLLYSGYLWRIINVNNDGTIKLITDDIVSSLVWNYGNNDYLNSYIYKWLNPIDEIAPAGTFYNTLDNTNGIIVPSSFCLDKVNDINNLECNQIDNSKVGLLEISDYKMAGGIDSYLNKPFYEWTMSGYDEKQVWFRLPSGELSNHSSLEDSYYSYGIRPVITISGNAIVEGGNGKKDKPYIITTTTVNSFAEIKIGQYISYSDYTWIVIDKDETKVKVVMDGYIKENNDDVLIPFSSKINKFNLKDKNNIGYYLNYSFYQSLTNPDYIVEGDWAIGNYNYKVSYDYTNAFKEIIKAKIGLLRVGELFINEYDEYALLTPTNEIDNTIFTVFKDGRLYADMIEKPLKVRPALYLDINLNIIEGHGTKDNPFVLTR